jgi:hypothetical protein
LPPDLTARRIIITAKTREITFSIIAIVEKVCTDIVLLSVSVEIRILKKNLNTR